MTISPISILVEEGHVTSQTQFEVGGVPYLMWTSPIRTEGHRQLRWRAYNAPASSTVDAKLAGPFGHLAAIDRGDGTVLVLYDDDTFDTGPDPVIRFGIFNRATGDVVRAPVPLDTGARPAAVALTSTRVVVAYLIKLTGRVHVQNSFDGGLTWRGREPVIGNKVQGTEGLSVVRFDDGTLTLAQIGKDTRPLRELGALVRTRPVVGIQRFESGAVYTFEAAQRVVAGVPQLSDNLRAAFDIGELGEIVCASTARQGTSDGYEAVTRLDVRGTTLAVAESYPVTATEPGADVSFVRMDGTPPKHYPLVTGASDVVTSVAVTPALVYFTSYSDVSGDGRFSVIRQSDGVAVPQMLGVACRTLCRAENPGAMPVVAVAYSDGLGEWVRFYVENADTPVLAATHKLHGRANQLAFHLDTVGHGWLYVGTSDYLAIYEVRGIDGPIWLREVYRVRGDGTVHTLIPCANGNVVAAMGAAGVMVFNARGERLAQLTPSGVAVDFWRSGRTYGVGDLVRPTEANPYAPQGRYFRCTQAGSAGTNEPAWASTGTVVDAGARWVEQGPLDPVVVGVTVDEDAKRIYAVGLLGGPTGTSSKVYVLAADGLV